MSREIDFDNEPLSDHERDMMDVELGCDGDLNTTWISEDIDKRVISPREHITVEHAIEICGDDVYIQTFGANDNKNKSDQ